MRPFHCFKNSNLSDILISGSTCFKPENNKDINLYFPWVLHDKTMFGVDNERILNVCLMSSVTHLSLQIMFLLSHGAIRHTHKTYTWHFWWNPDMKDTIRAGIIYSKHQWPKDPNIDGLVQDCSNSNALALKVLQSCKKLSICGSRDTFKRRGH